MGWALLAIVAGETSALAQNTPPRFELRTSAEGGSNRDRACREAAKQRFPLWNSDPAKVACSSTILQTHQSRYSVSYTIQCNCLLLAANTTTPDAIRARALDNPNVEVDVQGRKYKQDFATKRVVYVDGNDPKIYEASDALGGNAKALKASADTSSTLVLPKDALDRSRNNPVIFRDGTKWYVDEKTGVAFAEADVRNYKENSARDLGDIRPYDISKGKPRQMGLDESQQRLAPAPTGVATTPVQNPQSAQGTQPATTGAIAAAPMAAAGAESTKQVQAPAAPPVRALPSGAPNTTALQGLGDSCVMFTTPDCQPLNQARLGTEVDAAAADARKTDERRLITNQFQRASNLNGRVATVTDNNGKESQYIVNPATGVNVPVKLSADGKSYEVDTSGARAPLMVERNGSTRPFTNEEVGQLQKQDRVSDLQARYSTLNDSEKLELYQKRNELIEKSPPSTQGPVGAVRAPTTQRGEPKAVPEGLSKEIARGIGNGSLVEEKIGDKTYYRGPVGELYGGEKDSARFQEYNPAQADGLRAKAAQFEADQKVAEYKLGGESLFDRVKAADDRRAALKEAGLSETFNADANNSAIQNSKSALFDTDKGDPSLDTVKKERANNAEMIKIKKENIENEYKGKLSKLTQERDDPEGFYEASRFDSDKKALADKRTADLASLSPLEAKEKQFGALESAMTDQEKFGKLSQTDQAAASNPAGLDSKGKPLDEKSIAAEYKAATGRKFQARSSDRITEEDYRREKYLATAGKGDKNCQYSAASGATTNCGSTESSIKFAEISNQAIQGVGSLTVGTVGQYQQSKAAQSGSIADGLKAEAKTARVAGAQSMLSALTNTFSAFWQNSKRQGHEAQGETFNQTGQLADSNLTGKAGTTSAGKNETEDGYISAGGEGEVGRTTKAIVKNFKLNDDKYRLTVDVDDADGYERTQQQVQRNNQFKSKKKGMTSEVQEIAANAEQEQNAYAQRAQDGAVKSGIMALTGAAGAAISYNYAKQLNQSANTLNKSKNNSPDFNFDSPGTGTADTPGGSNTVSGEDTSSAREGTTDEEFPNLGVGDNLDAGPRDPAPGPVAGGFEPSLGAGGGGGASGGGGAVASGSTAPTAVDDTSKGEAQSPGNVSDRDATYQAYGGSRGLASAGSGKGGPDLGSLSGLMAKLFGDSEGEKERRGGIMKFADPRAPASQDSLLDRSVNLFKRVSDTYQIKNRAGAI